MSLQWPQDGRISEHSFLGVLQHRKWIYSFQREKAVTCDSGIVLKALAVSQLPDRYHWIQNPAGTSRCWYALIEESSLAVSRSVWTGCDSWHPTDDRLHSWFRCVRLFVGLKILTIKFLPVRHSKTVPHHLWHQQQDAGGTYTVCHWLLKRTESKHNPYVVWSWVWKPDMA